MIFDAITPPAEPDPEKARIFGLRLAQSILKALDACEGDPVALGALRITVFGIFAGVLDAIVANEPNEFAAMLAASSREIGLHAVIATPDTVQ